MWNAEFYHLDLDIIKLKVVDEKCKKRSDKLLFLRIINFVLKQNKTCDIFIWKNIGGIKGK